MPAFGTALGLIAASLLASPASSSPDRAHQAPLPATRIDDDAIELDGRVDEALWTAVPLLPPMTQRSPRFGRPPSNATDVRWAYGDRGIYVSFVCHSDDPKKVRAPFFPRDQQTTGDLVWIEIDANNDDTTGFVFATSPSGAIVDSQIFRDTQDERLWDGVWRSAARKTDEGWSAEFFVPWSTLRFDRSDEHVLGINVGRFVNEGAEETRLSMFPQGVPGRMSAAVDYGPVRGIEPGLNLELRPFVSGRFVLQRPQGSLDRSWRALPNGGFDLKYGIKGNLTLDLAVNPDFGQAEVDPALLNLSPFEAFFVEKRQFFLESKEIFETRFQLFYSRRVGNAPRSANAALDTRTVDGQPETAQLVGLDPLSRILGSVRITGEVAPGWVLGVLSATTGPTFGQQRFSDGQESLVPVDPLSTWSVVRLRRHFDSQTYVGGMVTNVFREGDAPEAYTGGFDYELNFRRRFRHGAQVIATHDGERSGMGGNLDLSHTTKRTSFRVSDEFLTPHANFSDLGFMTRTNYNNLGGGVDVFNAQPMGRIRQAKFGVSGNFGTSFAGQITEKRVSTDYRLETMGLWVVNAFFGGHFPQLDIFETRGGIPYEVPFHWWAGVGVESPRNKRVTFGLRTNYGEQRPQRDPGVDDPLSRRGAGPDFILNLILRPVDRLQFELGGVLNLSSGRPRWVATDENDQAIMANARRVTSNLNLRATLGILPRLSLTSFNQAFYSTAHHTAFYLLAAPDVLNPVDPAPYAGLVDQGLTSLVSNTILRWEFLPGSFAFVAYVHRSVFSENGMQVDYRPGRQFTNLVADGATHEDVLFLKVMHLFGF